MFVFCIFFCELCSELKTNNEMKIIYLIRHSKSDQSLGTLADVDRPLNLRGYSDAEKMSRMMKENKIVPDAIITSPAVRAISTALIFARTIDFNQARLSIVPHLYHSNELTYLDIIAEMDNKINTLMLFAHNPVITNTANRLTQEVIEHVPTSGIVGISNNCDTWEKFVASTGKLVLFSFPKNN